jgi:hypothetical protein
MKIAILCAVVLSAATAAAETVIIEYPDHYYVESTGTPEANPAPSREGGAPPARRVPAPDQESGAPSPAARPVTNFETQPVAPAERQAALEREIQRLQGLRSELTTPREGETAEQVDRRQREAEGNLRKINRLSAELRKIAVPGNE